MRTNLPKSWTNGDIYLILESVLKIATNWMFMMRRKKIFESVPQMIWKVLDREIGFYIPPHQRSYNWDEGHIRRLFEDIAYGERQILDKKEKDSITFIGTLIVIDDTQSETVVSNIIGSDRPRQILSVIDGQQRLTTILLTNICLHDEIKRRSNMSERKDDLVFKWLYDVADQVSKKLQETFEEDKREGEGVYQWQPRMIRAYVDSWGCTDEAKYNSPIAAFIHGYSKRIHDRNEDSANEPYTVENSISDSEILRKNYVEIQDQIKVILDEKKEDTRRLKQIAEDSSFQEAILKKKFPKNVCNVLSKAGNDDFKELIRLVLFANYLMDKVWVIVVSAPKAYAFDMFESLNTTGEALTVFETFRPKVIESEGLEEYETSVSYDHMQSIEKYLESFTKAKARQKETYNLLRSFALAESGNKLPSDPVDQRQYMRNQYGSLMNKEEERSFVENLKHVAEFMEKAWKQEGRPFSDIAEFVDRDEVLMCMDVLRRADHHITIGPLVRFYSQVLSASGRFRDNAIDELEGAIKAMTAFFALWRGAGRTTGALADQYRELMRKGFEKEGIEPFCRYQQGRKTPILTAEKLRKALKYALGKGRTLAITSKEDWVKLSVERPIYRVSQPLTRFLLFASFHRTLEDGRDPSFPTKEPRGIQMFTWTKWDSDLTIEHVAPQEPDSEQNDWSDQLYEKPDLLDYLGNLTLLPSAQNSSFKNRSWQAKKEMYNALSLLKQDALDAHLKRLQSQEILLSDSTKNLLRSEEDLQHLSTICNVERWTTKFVQKRSKRLAKLVWINIAPWLGFDDE